MDVNVIEHADKGTYKAWLTKVKASEQGLTGTKAQQHGSSPIVWLDDNTFIGGHDDTMAWLSRM